MERERDAEDRLTRPCHVPGQINNAGEGDRTRTNCFELGAAPGRLAETKQTKGASAASQSAGDDTGQNVSLVKVQTLEQEVENGMHNFLNESRE
jgi:hypothetical protein